jgi:hypothetical protein
MSAFDISKTTKEDPFAKILAKPLSFNTNLNNNNNINTINKLHEDKENEHGLDEEKEIKRRNFNHMSPPLRPTTIPIIINKKLRESKTFIDFSDRIKKLKTFKAGFNKTDKIINDIACSCTDIINNQVKQRKKIEKRLYDISLLMATIEDLGKNVIVTGSKVFLNNSNNDSDSLDVVTAKDSFKIKKLIENLQLDVKTIKLISDDLNPTQFINHNTSLNSNNSHIDSSINESPSMTSSHKYLDVNIRDMYNSPGSLDDNMSSEYTNDKLLKFSLLAIINRNNNMKENIDEVNMFFNKLNQNEEDIIVNDHIEDKIWLYPIENENELLEPLQPFNINKKRNKRNKNRNKIIYNIRNNNELNNDNKQSNVTKLDIKLDFRDNWNHIGLFINKDSSSEIIDSCPSNPHVEIIFKSAKTCKSVPLVPTKYIPPPIITAPIISSIKDSSRQEIKNVKDENPSEKKLEDSKNTKSINISFSSTSSLKTGIGGIGKKETTNNTIISSVGNNEKVNNSKQIISENNVIYDLDTLVQSIQKQYKDDDPKREKIEENVLKYHEEKRLDSYIKNIEKTFGVVLEKNIDTPLGGLKKTLTMGSLNENPSMLNISKSSFPSKLDKKDSSPLSLSTSFSGTATPPLHPKQGIGEPTSPFTQGNQSPSGLFKQTTPGTTPPSLSLFNKSPVGIGSNINSNSNAHIITALKNIYSKHDPTKVMKVEEILNKYISTGKLEQYLSQVESKYQTKIPRESQSAFTSQQNQSNTSVFSNKSQSQSLSSPFMNKSPGIGGSTSPFTQGNQSPSGLFKQTTPGTTSPSLFNTNFNKSNVPQQQQQQQGFGGAGSFNSKPLSSFNSSTIGIGSNNIGGSTSPFTQGNQSPSGLFKQTIPGTTSPSLFNTNFNKSNVPQQQGFGGGNNSIFSK